MSAYRYRFLDSPFEALLNEWGEAGWRVAGVVSPYNALSGFTVIMEQAQ